MAIQQHPLPQDISNYRFRLIGDMTIKQFASLGICVILAIISYSLPLPFFFKYPIVFAFVLLGIGMAFVPVEGRSLDIWLLAFIKSIYSPTQYIWKRSQPSDSASETAAPTKENNLEVVKPVTNASIGISSSPTPSPAQATVTEEPKTTLDEPKITAVEPPEIIPKQEVENPLPVLPKPVEITPPQKQEIIPETPAPTTNLPIPFTPTTPNTLVGLTLTPTGHILDGVLVEIKKDNLTLRATKSNKLGQFMFARPLDSGLYQILAEKENLSFAPYSLELTGDIVKPLKIQAQ